MKTIVHLAPLLILLLSYIHESNTYSTGAPDQKVCQTLLPNHGDLAKPQTGDSPYIINLSNTDVKGGDSVRVTLTSRTGTTEFKGFFTKAQKSDGKMNTGSGIPTGNFKLSGTRTKFVTCGEYEDRAVTHTTSDGKKSVTFDWVVLNEDGDFVFLTTFVQDFSTIWVKQTSDVIHVKKNAALTSRTT